MFEQLKQIIDEVYQSKRTVANSQVDVPVLSEEGLEDHDIVSLWELIAKQSTHLASPKMFGHMDAAPHPVAALTDALVSSLNNNMLFRELSPFASQVETYLCQEFANRLGLTSNMSSCFCSGGTLANLTALFAAVGGFAPTIERKDFYLFVSEMAHNSLKKAAAVLGLPADHLIVVPCDDEGIMSVDAMEKLLKQHVGNPCIVNATLGTTLNGAVDPIEALAVLKEKYSFWLHVDAVYGGALCFSKRYRHFLSGVDAADSVALGPQKWMYVPRMSAIVFVKKHSAFDQTLEMSLPYSVSEFPHLGSWGIQGSRRADALTLWVTLQAMGVKKLGDLIDNRIDFTKTCYQILLDHPDFKPIHEPHLNLLLFTTSQPTDLREVHKQLTQKQQEWVSLITWRKKTVFRCVFLHPKTGVAHFNQLLKVLSSLTTSPAF